MGGLEHMVHINYQKHSVSKEIQMQEESEWSGGFAIRSNMMDAVALKQTHQDSKNTLLVLPAFLSVPQFSPRAVHPGPLFHSAVTLANALLHVFCLSFASQDRRRQTQNFVFAFLLVEGSRALGWHLPSPLSLNFSFMFPPYIIPLFHAFYVLHPQYPEGLFSRGAHVVWLWNHANICNSE